MLETSSPGGQAGSSSRIENYLGFPTGILAIRKFTIYPVTFMFIYNYHIIVTHVQTASDSCLYFMWEAYNA